MVWLPEGEKKFEDRVDGITACDRQTDILTDGRTDILPQHSQRYGHAFRGNNPSTYYVFVSSATCTL